MIYKSFKIKNFKGIDEVNVDLANSRIITLVGLNESGKTSIMEGVQLFYRIAKGENPTTEQLNEFRPKGINFSGKIEVSATLILEDEDKKKIYYRSFGEYRDKKNAKTMEKVLYLALLESMHKRLAYLRGKKILALSDYIKRQKKSAPAVLNAAKRQNIPAFREKGIWKIGERLIKIINNK